MDFLNLDDLIAPTNPYASLFFGSIVTIIAGFVLWLDSKRFKTVLLTMIAGLAVTGTVTAFLFAVGYYS